MKSLVIGSVVAIIAATGLIVWWSHSSAAPVEVSGFEAPPTVAPMPEPTVVKPAPLVREAQVVAPAPVVPVVAPVIALSTEQQREASIASATKHAVEKFEVLRPQVVQHCWVDSHAAETGGTAGVALEITFNAAGEEIARGGGEQRGSVPGVAGCVREMGAGTMRIEPPGQTVTVPVRVSLP